MDKKEFLENLKAEIEKQEKKIALYKTLTEPVSPDNAIGRVSRMDAINNKSVTESALREAGEKLRKLNQVRENVNDPDFGICKKCRQQIVMGRLLIRPESTLCVNCAR